MVIIVVDIAQIAADTRSTQAAAFAPGTFSNLITQWVKFLLFCISFDLLLLPASNQTLCWYVQFLSYTFKSHASIVNYVSGVKTLHLLLGYDVSAFASFLFKLTIRGIKRLKPYQPKQALAINPIMLHHIYQTLDLTDPLDATFWAACLTAFFLLLRKSNFVADSISTMDTSKLLCREDIAWLKGTVLVTLRWSKTNQFGQHLTFSLPYIPNSPLCPVTALYNMWGLVPGDTGVCFKRVDGTPFTYYQFHVMLRRALKLQGYPQDLFSSHSIRRGGGDNFCLPGGGPDRSSQTFRWLED